MKLVEKLNLKLKCVEAKKEKIYVDKTSSDGDEKEIIKEAKKFKVSITFDDDNDLYAVGTKLNLIKWLEHEYWDVDTIKEYYPELYK